MAKQKWMAIITALVMLGSIASFGFAYMGIGDPGQNPNDPNLPSITSSVINRVLTQQEVSMILRSGGVIIENYYFPDCSGCVEDNAVLEAFALRFNRFVVLSTVEINPVSEEGEVELDEKLRMLTGRGSIIDLDRSELSGDYLLEKFCKVAQVQPAECVLMQI